MSVGYTGHLSSQACPGGCEIYFCNHRNSIRRDEGHGVPCCHEETEVLIVVNKLISYLNHISRTCVVDRKQESMLTTQAVTHSSVATINSILLPMTFSSKPTLYSILYCHAFVLPLFSSCSTQRVRG